MHEMSLCQGVIQILEEQGAAHHFSRVKMVRLEIGPLAAVEPGAMRFCFGAVARGTLAESAELDIITTEVTAWCFPCGDLVTIKDRPAVCPNCGGYQLQMTGGNELRIKELEVA